MRLGTIALVALTLGGLCSLHAQEAAPTGGQSCEVPPTIDCTPKQDCSLNADTRECNTCVVSLFGHCSIRGNDPACEAAKAAQSALYAAQKAQCESQKVAQKAACEATKEALKSAAESRCKNKQ
jgi:hypothetical protein